LPKQELTEQEWSHFYDVEDLENKPDTLTIEASEEELQDIARRLGINEMKKASATLTLMREQGGRVVHVSGTFEATVVQECVVSGDPVETNLSESVEGWFADKESTVSFAAVKREKEASQSHGEVEIMDERDDPEPILDGVIDLGELVTQHISLALPPYPHKEGAKYEFGDDNLEIDEKSPLRKNPFEALKDWKENR
jgi:uncharacterized metal-binding protein YceD (DUF177 family)